MERKPYSFTNKIFRLSRVIFISMIVISVLGFVLALGAYNISIQGWVINNSHGSSPGNPINPTQPSSTVIPYFTIFTTNIISILFIPLILITIINTLLFQAKRIVIRKEINALFQTLKLQQSDSMTAFISLNHNNRITIKGNYNGSFSLIKDDTIFSYISGDELLWKIHYLTYKHLNNKRKNKSIT